MTNILNGSRAAEAVAAKSGKIGSARQRPLFAVHRERKQNVSGHSILRVSRIDDHDPPADRGPPTFREPPRADTPFTVS